MLSDGQTDAASKDDIIRMARDATAPEWWDNGDSWHMGMDLQRFARSVASAAASAEREACARVCDEMQEHWSAIKDTALLNGDVDLSNASSGEPRAAESLAALIRARGMP